MCYVELHLGLITEVICNLSVSHPNGNLVVQEDTPKSLEVKSIQLSAPCNCDPELQVMLTFACLPSITATQELVVPKSIPTTAPLIASDL